MLLDRLVLGKRASPVSTAMVSTSAGLVACWWAGTLDTRLDGGEPQLAAIDPAGRILLPFEATDR